MKWPKSSPQPKNHSPKVIVPTVTQKHGVRTGKTMDVLPGNPPSRVYSNISGTASSWPVKKRSVLLLRRVSGVSMEPYVGPGAIVVARGFFLRLKKYDVVVVQQNGIEKIKRILHIKNGKIFLIGDNPQKSTDSRHFGWLPKSAVIGKVVWPH